MELLQELFRQDEKALMQHLSLLENIGILCQVTPEKDILLAKLLESLNMKVNGEDHM